ncbi:MAG: SPOR domain-containing protein, partial [Gallionella sp.]
MKKLLIALLFANLAVFAAFQWGGALFQDDSKIQAAPLLHPEIMSIVSAPLNPVAIAPVNATLNTANLVCMEWSDFSGSDLVRATEALSPLKLGNKLSTRPIEYASGFWVYLAPLKDKTAVANKIEQLKARGVTEYFVVQEAGAWLHAISLGVFKSEEAANHYLASLKEQGVNSAKVG